MERLSREAKPAGVSAATLTPSELSSDLHIRTVAHAPRVVFAAALGDETRSTRLNRPTWSLLGKGAKGGVGVNQSGAEMEREKGVRL